MIKFLQNLFGKKSAEVTPTKTTPSANKKRGKIRYFNYKKGYGFITSEQTEEDVFVHVSDLPGRVKVGMPVLFATIEEPKGVRAKDIELVNVRKGKAEKK